MERSSEKRKYQARIKKMYKQSRGLGPLALFKRLVSQDTQEGKD